ncbi:unnamed protein product [Didymodactylos carnosus]|uniref:Neurotransmitter-gated ion-channel ligand-binding domain-containing protein n=1 Tax=Didymodactylos carnosus TaxID=1234261 RepID=A0A8S2HZ99_9BILA|nr:unnamed protein product [Didymodactylos carnosus]CAF3701853.1 unnamed protein product [Didymodactylos carnosus]
MNILTHVGDTVQSTAIPVGIRLMFSRIGEIDTLNEKYQAQVYIEARWSSDLVRLKLTTEQHRQLNEGKSVTILKFNEKNWTPELFIENAIGELKEVLRYTLKKGNTQRSGQLIEICEHRDLKGVFWEKLELHHFPSDVQELTVSVTTSYYDDKVVLHKDEYYQSGINRAAFVDQQEWMLYQHVETQTRFTKEYPFRDENDAKEEQKRSVFSVTCHAVCSFCTFTIPPNLPQSRLQIDCTLLLTSITFRWVVNRSLSSAEYFEKYYRNVKFFFSQLYPI